MNSPNDDETLEQEMERLLAEAEAELEGEDDNE